jgi:PAS domain S-box-containing protein
MDADSAERVGAALRGARGGHPERLPLTLIARDGRPVPASAEVGLGSGGDAVVAVSILPDWPREDAVRLLDLVRDLAVSIRPGPEIAFRYVSAASTAVTGYGPGELAADPALFTGGVHPDDRGLIRDALADPGRLGVPVVFRFRHRDRGWRRLELVGFPVLDGAGRVAVVHGVVRDVTVPRDLDGGYRLLVERSPGMVYRLRLVPDRVLEYVSPACETVTGYPPGEFYRDPLLLLRLVHPDDLPALEAFVTDPGELRGPLVFRALGPDGSFRWIELVNVPVRDGAGRLVALEGVCRDVTGQKEVEAALQAVNRRMNLLASLTRHDILNQLTVLLGALELARGAGSDAELAWFLGRSREAAWAIQRLTEFTRDYQEIGQGAPRWVRVPELVRRAAASFAGDGAVVEVAEDPWEIRADPLIELVFYNLVENALRHGGTVTRIVLSVEEEPSGGLVIACEDDGEGVPVNEKERIFKRGYGRHTGLGLSLAAEILASTDMTIAETGRAGLGARFEIRVPPGACRRAREPPREEPSLPNR